MGMLQHLEICQEVGERAFKENQIETMLCEMKKIWKDIVFKLSPFKTSSIIKGFDDIQQVLDEHIVNT